MDDLSFFDKLRTQTRLFLMGNREFIAIFGILILTASVIYSTKIITLPTRVPTSATVPSPTPTLIVTPVPTITESDSGRTPTTSSGFLELLQLSPTEPASGGPLPISTLTATPSVPDGTIFLPPLPR